MRLIVTATDTDVGKTVVSAMLVLAFEACYWKPIQSGSREGTDTETVARLTGVGPDRLLPERWVLSEPLSPHRAAELEGVAIALDDLHLPASASAGRPLIIEGAGGVLVPINRDALEIDAFPMWQAPVVVCARTALGTINHTLLTIEALRRRSIPIQGIVFVGTGMDDSERTIVDFSGVRRLGRLPPVTPLTRHELVRAFARHFDPAQFRMAPHA